MKKILVAFDGSYYSESALNYAVQMAKTTDAMVYGIFLEDITAYHQFSPVFSAPEMIGLADEAIIELKKENRQNINENIEKFRDACTKAEIRFGIDREEGMPSKELIEESKYADLILLGSVTYFSNISYASDYNLISDLLENSHCPVIVVPEKSYQIKNVVLTFDGTASSIYAIKNFLYLFRDMVNEMKLSLVSVLKKDEEHVEGERRMLSFIHLYCSNCTREKIVGKPVDEILHFAETTENSLVVMGSYGRSAFFKFFRSSVGEKVIKSRSVPVFVAHE